MTTDRPYRPHNPGHDYYESGAYLVTLVVSGREPRLSVLNDDVTQPAVNLTHQGNSHYLSAMAGATVLVTPGISEGEKRIKNMAIERGLPLILLQKEPISSYWKPERQRFEACTRGRLLILAPWDATALGVVNGVPAATDYSQFHNLNRLAEEICQLLPQAYSIT